MLFENLLTIFVLLTIFQLRLVYSQWDGYNGGTQCCYNSYSQTGYPYSYSQPDGYDSTSYQSAYPYGSYVITGFYDNYTPGDIYDSSLLEAKQPIIIVVENKEKHDEFTFDDLISLSLDLVKNLPKDSCSCPCNYDCCESRKGGRFEFYSECNSGPCNKKKCNKKSCCKSECGCSSNNDCCRNYGNCKHIMICEC